MTEPGGVVLREPTVDDAPALGRMHHRSWLESYVHLLPPEFFDVRWTEADAVAWWRAELTDVPTRRARFARLVAVGPDGSVAGFVLVSPSRVEDGVAPARETDLTMLYVAREHQGTGLAQRLVEVALGDVPAEVWVFVGNPRAEAFYRRLGFELDGVDGPHPSGLRGVRMVR